ncbi:MAG: U32 family peptidase [Clostridia bacterium]|nr:U32 family peptidase [Clostridia bacterium]
MRNKVELLAPAGSWDAFLAAVQNGADAVYLGGKLFNARQLAQNFDEEILKKAVDYAHVRDVNVFLTMNTLMSDAEMKEALDFVGQAYEMGIDGIIVQDLGLAALLRKVFPGLPLHASTQMTVYNREGVEALHKSGFQRVVLSRELSVKEISDIVKNTPLEIEVFIHGALCISYSGQCLMSSIIGGRSGNRGKCAQPCRLQYSMVSTGEGKGGKLKNGNAAKNGAYLLSPKDLCSMPVLGDVLDAGVKSLKIEGRMKSPEYVATVVRIYRNTIDKLLAGGKKDSVMDPADMRELTQIFNRGGFSTGYLEGKSGKSMMCFEKPKNWGIYAGNVISYDKVSKLVKVKLTEDLSMGDGVEIWSGEEESPGTVVSEIKRNGKHTEAAKAGDIVEIGRIGGIISKGNRVYKTSDRKLNEKAKESYSDKERRKSLLHGRINIRNGHPAVLMVEDNMGNSIEAMGDIPSELAVNKPITRERILDQLNKTGSTPFLFEKIEVEIDEGIALSIGEINNVRRKALEGLEEERKKKYEREITKEILEKKEGLLNFPGNSRKGHKEPEISMFFYRLYKEMDYNRLQAGRIYLPFHELFHGENQGIWMKVKESGSKVFTWLPAVTRGNYDRIMKSRLNEIGNLGLDGVLVGNLGSMELLKQIEGLNIFGDYSFNAFNSFTVEELYYLGLKGITLSPELTLGQISRLKEVSAISKEALVYGRLTLMTSEYCPVGSTHGSFGSMKPCGNACNEGIYSLKDRKGMHFPVLCDKTDCRSMILNSKVLFLPDDLDKMKTSGLDALRMNFVDESLEEIYEIVALHRALLEETVDHYGKYTNVVERIKEKGFTKGHYFRGV